MATIALKIEGLSKLQKMMTQFPAVVEKYVNPAISRSLVRILGAEKTQAPVRTGNLRDNWSLITGRFQGTMTSRATSGKGNTPYGAFVEFGTRFMKANPFLQRSLSSATDGINSEFKNALDSTLKELNQLSD